MRNAGVGVAAVAVAAMLCVPAAAWPQAFPVKPVRVVVPFPPGGANDTVARIVSQKLAEQMGQPFVIENRSGAGGTLGTAVVAQSPRDGYTLLVQSVASHVSNAHLYKKLAYDALGDFTGIASLTRLVGVLTVHPSMPTYSVKAFLDLAQQRPKEILFAHAGYGSFIHLNTVLLESATGMRITQVPFKGGGPAVVSLVSGETQAIAVGVGDIIEHLKARRARPLGVTSLDRMKQLPDVPAIAETVPGFESETWVSFLAPAGTPAAVIDRLHGEIGKVLRDAAIASRLSAMTYDPIYRSPDGLNRRLKAEHARIGSVLGKAGARLD